MSYELTRYLRGTESMTASTLVGIDLLVTTHTVVNQVDLCAVGEAPTGVAANAAIASGAAGAVQLLSQGDIVRGECSAAIAIGDHLKPAAAGQIAPEASVAVRTDVSIGKALSATTTQGDKFYWIVI